MSSLTAHHYSVRASLHTEQHACSLTSAVERVHIVDYFGLFGEGGWEEGRKRKRRHCYKYIWYFNIRNIRNIKLYLIAEDTTFTVLLEYSTMAEDTAQHTSSAAVTKRPYRRRGPNQEKF